MVVYFLKEHDRGTLWVTCRKRPKMSRALEQISQWNGGDSRGVDGGSVGLQPHEIETRVELAFRPEAEARMKPTESTGSLGREGWFSSTFLHSALFPVH